MTQPTNDAAIWERVFREHGDAFRSAPVTVHQQDCLAFLKQHGTRSVLDVGCGIGRWAVHFAREGLQVSGFDLSSTGVAVGRRWAQEEDLKVELQAASVEDPVFSNRRFDAVVAAMVLDNLPTPMMIRTLTRIHSWLAPGGVFYALFNPCLTAAEVAELSASPNPTSGVQTHYYADKELQNFLAEFEITSCRTYEEGVRAFFMRPQPTGS